MSYGPVQLPTGTVLQSGVPKSRRRAGAARANGLLLRGCVLVTYVVDDPAHPDSELDDRFRKTAVYCDCITFTNIPGQRWLFLPKVLVSQDRGGIQEGRVWKPRASSIDVTTSSMNNDGGTNPANLDGDHVLIGFLNDNLNEPVILRGLPHPMADVGQELENPGRRMCLKVADGDPSYWKHHGAFYGISEDGDFVVDLVQAYAGAYLQEDGKQPSPPGGGASGNYLVRLPDGSQVVISIDGVTEKSVAIAEPLETLYTTGGTGVKPAHDTHVHPTGTGPSGVASVAFPAWDAKIVSDRMKVPETT